MAKILKKKREKWVLSKKNIYKANIFKKKGEKKIIYSNIAQ